MKILVTGHSGFIGKNLCSYIQAKGHEAIGFGREHSLRYLNECIEIVDAIVHLAGENRPRQDEDFNVVNVGLTESICDSVRSSGKKLHIVFASSTQANLNNAYGKSKLKAEIALKKLEADTCCSVHMFRLPGVFGKWCKPNYNSVVATFCHNVSRNLPIQVHNPSLELKLVFIDDVVKEFLRVISNNEISNDKSIVKPVYMIKLGDLANQINAFKESRDSLIIDRVGKGIVGKLYSTYLSYLPPEQFSYSIPMYCDERGIFAEVLKTKDSGQFSYFTAGPGVIRGGHYHNSKTEKFLVVKGKAKFKFRHIETDEIHEIISTSKDLKIVETVPGWSHSITNIGNNEMVVMVWANEIFNPDCPDTIAYKV